MAWVGLGQARTRGNIRISLCKRIMKVTSSVSNDINKGFCSLCRNRYLNKKLASAKEPFSPRKALIIWKADCGVTWVHTYKWGTVKSMSGVWQLGLLCTRQGFLIHIHIYIKAVKPLPREIPGLFWR